MAGSTAGALKQIIESAGLGIAAYADDPPSNAVLPYVIIQDEITVTTGDSRSSGLTDSGIDVALENCQVDLYQTYIDPDTRRVAENKILANALRRALHRSQPTTASADAPWRIYGVRVAFTSRARRADDNTVRTRMSVNVHRDL
jgi:hypothetical protein